MRVARAAEEAGTDFLGIADTPLLRGAAFPTVQHLLSTTARLAIGTFVTSPVLRHPAVLAADFALLGQLYPGRVIAGLGSGDSAVRSLGVRPARTAAVAEAARMIRHRAGPGTAVLIAASGLRMAGSVPGEADGIIIGGGLDTDWLRTVISTAEQSAGRRLARWAFAIGVPPASDAAAPDGRRVLTSVVTVSRHALARDPASRGVPHHLHDGLRRIYADYDVAAYGDPDGVNARLLAEHPDERDYLLERFAVGGEPAVVADRLNRLATETGLDGLVLTTSVGDPSDVVHGLAGPLVPLVSGAPPVSGVPPTHSVGGA